MKIIVYFWKKKEREKKGARVFAPKETQNPESDKFEKREYLSLSHNSLSVREGECVCNIGRINLWEDFPPIQFQFLFCVMLNHKQTAKSTKAHSIFFFFNFFFRF